MSTERVIKDIPNISQYKDIEGKDRQRNACGVVGLLMIMKYLKPELEISADDLYDEGVKINGLIEAGWKHLSLCALARNYGFTAYNEEFISNRNDTNNLLCVYGIEKMKRCVGFGLPPLISIKHKDREGTHMAVLKGYLENKFFIQDPEIEVDTVLSLSEFENRWSKRSIFLSLPDRQVI